MGEISNNKPWGRQVVGQNIRRCKNISKEEMGGSGELIAHVLKAALMLMDIMQIMHTANTRDLSCLS